MHKLCVGLSLILVTLGGSNPGAASERESRAISSLYRRAMELAQDVRTSALTMVNGDIAQMNAGASPNPYARVDLVCMSMLSNAADSVGAELHALYVSVSLSELAVSAPDRASATEFSRITVQEGMDTIVASRKTANDAEGSCPQSVIVNQKAQEVMSLLTEAQSELSRLQREIGRSKYWTGAGD